MISLQNVQRAIQANNTLPVLNNILIKTENGKIVLIGTNLEIAIQSEFDATIETEGSFTVPSKILSSYIALLSEKEDLEIQVGATGFLNIKHGISETKIKGINSEDFPIIPKIEKESETTLSADLLKNMISQVAFSASTNQSRPVLMGILFELDGMEIKMAATDSYRLSERKLSTTGNTENKLKVVIPSKSLLELSKIISGEDPVHIIFAKNQVVFEWKNVKLMSRLIEGVFPDYKSVIPLSSTTEVEVLRDEFILALKKLAIFASENNGSIQMSVTNDEVLHVFTEKTQNGESKESIKVKVKGKNTKVSINTNYMIDVLQNIETEKVKIEMGEKITPIIIKPLNKNGYINIIMPLR